MLAKLSLLFVIAFTAVSHAATAPIDRFTKVDNDVYRGAFITKEAQMAFLKEKGVKTIVSMITDKAVAATEKQMADKYGIKMYWIPVDGFWGPNDKQTKVIQAHLNNSNEQPVYIHCTHGRDRTGVEVGLYRVWTDGWTAHDAYSEMKKMGFRTILFPMTKYFKSRSGFENEEDAGIND